MRKDSKIIDNYIVREPETKEVVFFVQAIRAV